MPSRNINGNNYEVQLRNCFSSISNAFGVRHPIDRIVTLSKNDIIGLRRLEFSNFDSRIRNEGITPNYTYTYRLNQRYALTVSGEYSNNCFTVLLMITDRQANARFGFKTVANFCKTKALHIIANIPIFGVHCVINYNPDTDYYVFSIRPPLSNSDLEMENTYAVNDECSLICLNVGFLQNTISYEVFGNKLPVDNGLFASLARGIRRIFNNTKALKIDKDFTIEIDTDILDVFNKTEFSINENRTLKYENVGGIHGLNLSCSYEKSLTGRRNLSGGVSYTQSLDDSFDLTISGEYSTNSEGSITVPLMVTHKKNGFAFGIEFELGGINKLKQTKKGCFVVLKIPAFKTEFVIKIDITDLALRIGKFIYVMIRPKKCPKPDGVDPDKKGAADDGCDLICLEADFIFETIVQDIIKYEVIKGYASKQHTFAQGNVRDESLSLRIVEDRSNSRGVPNEAPSTFASEVLAALPTAIRIAQFVAPIVMDVVSDTNIFDESMSEMNADVFNDVFQRGREMDTAFEGMPEMNFFDRDFVERVVPPHL